MMLFAFISTLGIYLSSMIIFRTMFDVAYIFDSEVMSKIIIITILCWLPFWLINFFYHKYFPETHEKV